MSALKFILSPLGLEPVVDFALTETDGAPGLYSLTAIADENLRLFVLDAATHLPGYRPTITDQQRELLELDSADNASVLVVINPGVDAATTVNLMAPIVVNVATGASAQIILEGQDWPLKADLASVASR